MKLATKEDKEKVIRILSESFETNPSVNWVIKSDDKRVDRIKELVDFSFETGLENSGVYLSSDEKGAAICFPYHKKKSTLSGILNQVKLVAKAIGVGRVGKVLKRESYINKHRIDKQFLYFWFLGVLNEARGSEAAYELRNEFFRLSEDLNLPICLETSVEQNKIVYQRFGFEVYHTWIDEEKGIHLWFMRREPK